MTLELLGLDGHAHEVYRAVLAHPEADLDRVSRAAGLDLHDTRAAVGQLVELGLVGWDDDRGGRVRLHDPAAALSALVAHRQAEIARRQGELDQSRTAVSRLLALRAELHADPASRAGLADWADADLGVERLPDAEAVRAQVERLAAGCREEAWSFNPAGPLSPLAGGGARPLQEQVLGRGVRIRAIYLDGVRAEPAALERAGWLLGRGAEVRTLPELPMRMVVVDRATALVPVDDHQVDRGALVVTGRDVVAGLVSLFVMTWRSARPLGARPVRRSNEPSPQETQALRLWAQGATDAVVARALGVSERTVRRMSESLAERLGARSRFEAGARAVEAGWLTDRDLV